MAPEGYRLDPWSIPGGACARADAFRALTRPSDTSRKRWMPYRRRTTPKGPGESGWRQGSRRPAVFRKDLVVDVACRHGMMASGHLDLVAVPGRDETHIDPDSEGDRVCPGGAEAENGRRFHVGRLRTQGFDGRG